MNFKQVVAYFGSDATEAGIRFQFASRLKNYANLLKRARAAGLDCKDVKFEGNAYGRSVCIISHSSQHCFLSITQPSKCWFQKEIARIMGSDVTPNGLRFQFTDRFRPVAKRQLEILEAGGDPKDVDLNTGGKGSE